MRIEASDPKIEKTSKFNTIEEMVDKYKLQIEDKYKLNIKDKYELNLDEKFGKSQKKKHLNHL